MQQPSNESVVNALISELSARNVAGEQLFDMIQKGWIVPPNFNGYACIHTFWEVHSQRTVGISLHVKSIAELADVMNFVHKTWTENVGDFKLKFEHSPQSTVITFVTLITSFNYELVIRFIDPSSTMSTLVEKNISLENASARLKDLAR